MVNYNPNPSPRLHFNFRSADSEIVFGKIHAGQSVEVIGVGSVGKSNFVRHIIRRDVQDHYLYQRHQEQANCIFIGLDANALLEPIPSAMDALKPSGWAGYELIASRLIRAVMEQGILNHLPVGDPSHPEQIYAMYRRLWPDDNDNVHIIAFRYLEDMIQRIFDGIQHPIRLVFIFDEFEKFIEELPPRFFQSLRSLRDQHKDHIIFLTTARQIMPLLLDRARMHQYEAFMELFSRHFLLPYRPSDTEQTFNRMAVRRDLPAPPPELRHTMMAVTGGHAGLLRSAFSAWAPMNLLHPSMSDNELISVLVRVADIDEECKTIWRSLSQDERQLLLNMVHARQQNRAFSIEPYQAIPQLLIKKEILLETEAMNFDNIRPALFAAYLYAAIPDEASNDDTLPSAPGIGNTP